MVETVWPRLRGVVRLLAFLAGLTVVGVGILSALHAPIVGRGVGEPTRQIAPELLAIVGGCLWMLLVTKL